ncbi:MAG TPA: carboxylesterase family protein [Fontimonas sp.]
MTIVKVRNGSLRGSVEDGIHSFKAVPYAEPLTATSRWQAPVPRGDWQGVRDATHYGPACMQFGSGRSRLPFPRMRAAYLRALGGDLRVVEGDDCLTLNVWTPGTEAAAKRPVMVWIHGGGFHSGSANEVYDATRFARRDAVCVVIQYRLGALGFLHGSGLFEDSLCEDNRAFLDQLCALRWVQDNIAAFGGDASNVTLFGQSAGAFAIYQLAASPLAAGLFRRVIALGGMPGTCAPAEEYHALTRDVLQDIGVRSGDSKALAALDRAALLKLQAAVSRRIFSAKHRERYGSLSRLRIAYLGAATGTAFLPRAPLDRFRAGTSNGVDMMLGTCAADGQLFSLMLPLGEALSARLFATNLTGLLPGADPRAARRHYAAQLPGVSATQIVARVNNDAFYRMPTVAAAAAHAASHPGRTWLFQLDYQSALPGLGAVHAIDVALLFRTPPVTALIRDDAQTAALSDLMCDAMVSFARCGTPAAPGMPAWPPYDTQQRPTMIFDTPCRLEMQPDEALHLYWKRA